MDQTRKDELLAKTRNNIDNVTETIGHMVDKLDASLKEGPGTFYTADSETAFEDQVRALAAETNTGQLLMQMEELESSPYFSRMDLAFEDEPERAYYIAKYSASELGIYSWTSAIAALRFEMPGVVSYKTPRGIVRSGDLNRKDQYMIARGHLNFMTTESVGRERDLVYQEHFSGRKTGFVLPEVVAQMEKAQDQVIRAEPRGPFAISGPAGSGKTTLALHRVAFLRQSPETTEQYPPETILVLVQDAGTENYFSHLLPELGIHDVEIQTFSHWAIAVLGIGNYFYHARPGRNEHERDRYEFAKLGALRSALPEITRAESKYPNAYLIRHYARHLDTGQMGLLKEELEEGALDRYDLTILLIGQIKTEGSLLTTTEDVTYLSQGRTKRKPRKIPLEYSLILVDEFQNYIPEQLRVLRSVTDKKQSMLYIGDLAQQTQFGALGDWSEIDETIPPERAIKLEKVYRNTRQILEYVRSLGYGVDIPEGVIDGPAVAQYPVRDVAEALQYIVGLTKLPGALTGIIAKDPADIETFAEYFAEDKSVRCLTMREAQGVEFDRVILVGLDEDTFADSSAEPELAAAQKQVNKDLLYVALTRAMTELHVLGEIRL